MITLGSLTRERGFEKNSVIQTWQYPAGEVGISISAENDTSHIPKNANAVLAQVVEPGDIMALIQVASVLPAAQRQWLILPYFPYSRQDREQQTEKGVMPNALRCVTEMIDNLGFEHVVTVDPHSAILEGMFRSTRLHVLPSGVPEKIEDHLIVAGRSDNTIVLAPDVGAARRAEAVANHNDLRLVVGQKNRRASTGEINPILLPPLGEVSRVIVVDDICDGGATFAATAKAILGQRKTHTPELWLYVTHGIFSGRFKQNLKDYAFVVFSDTYPQNKQDLNSPTVGDLSAAVPSEFIQFSVLNKLNTLIKP